MEVDIMDLSKMICTPEQAAAKREYAKLFCKFDFNWQRMPQDKKKED
jgi:hypothetical protein